MDIKVKDIIKICDAQLVYGNEEEICQNFSKDTREIKKDDVYIGIKGENFDGNALYEKALENGAKVCILENIEIPEHIIERYKDRTIIKVKNMGLQVNVVPYSVFYFCPLKWVHFIKTPFSILCFYSYLLYCFSLCFCFQFLFWFLCFFWFLCWYCFFWNFLCWFIVCFRIGWRCCCR